MKQQYVCPTDNNEVVERKDMVKGFEYARDQYVKFGEDEMKALEAERTDSLDLIEFCPLDTIDFVHVEKSYYLGPDKGGERAYRLLSEALKSSKKVAVGRFSTRGRDNLVVVRPYKDGLILHELFYADEVRSFEDVETGSAFEFKPIEVDLAHKLIDELSQPKFRPEAFKDEYAERVRAAVDKKVAGEEVSFAPEAPKAQIIDLLEALKRSVANAAANTSSQGADRDEEEAPKSAPNQGPKKAAPRKVAAKAKKTASGD